MRYIAVSLLAVLGGKASTSSADIEKILRSVAIETEGEKVKKVISVLEGKSIDEVIAQGRDKLSSMPAGGGAVAPAAAGGAAPSAGEKKEAKNEDMKEESESEDDDIGFALFD